MMPLASGDNKISLLKANATTKDIPIILMSGRSENELLSIILKTGADAYLTKPFTKQKLIDVVSTTLRNAAVSTSPITEQ
jgi:two-component system phosphate regulon response regulator PhoB